MDETALENKPRLGLLWRYDVVSNVPIPRSYVFSNNPGYHHSTPLSLHFFSLTLTTKTSAPPRFSMSGACAPL